MHHLPTEAFAAFVTACLACCRVQPLTDRLFDFGGYRVQVRFVGTTETAFFTDAIAHRDVSEKASLSNLTVHVVDGRKTGLSLPRPPWNWQDADGYGTITGIDPAAGYVNYQGDYGVLTLIDFPNRRALIWADDVSRLPEWERSFPFRMLLHKWLENSPYVLVHAGAVGMPDGGFLLAGSGGSGKSTSTLACLDSPLRYAGDDFVMVDTEETRVHSLYNVAKLNADNLHRFPHWEPLIANRAALPEQKGQLFIHQHHPERVTAGFPVVALLLPRFSGGRATTLRQATKADALRALAPSTLALLRDTVAGGTSPTFRKVVSVVRSLPCYWLETGTDLPQIPECLLDLLHQIRHSNAPEPTAALDHSPGF